MFQKDKSVEEYVAKTIKPPVEKEIEFEKNVINKPVKTKKDKINLLK